MSVRDNDHHLHVRASDHTEESVHVLLVDPLSIRGHVRVDVVTRSGQDHGTAEILEILHRPRNRIHPRQSGEFADQVHGAGHTRDRTAAVRRAQSEILPSAKLQIPVRPVGAIELYRAQVQGISFVHVDFGSTRELFVVSHQGAGTLDVETAKFLRPEQH